MLLGPADTRRYHSAPGEFLVRRVPRENLWTWRQLNDRHLELLVVRTDRLRAIEGIEKLSVPRFRVLAGVNDHFTWRFGARLTGCYERLRVPPNARRS
jgi:hypothetical protein